MSHHGRKLASSLKNFFPCSAQLKLKLIISLADVNQKILVLRNKSQLKNHREFKRVYIQSAKSHVERLLELNARTLLRELPQGRSYRVSGNGRILRRQGNDAAETAANRNQNGQQAQTD